MRNIFKNVIAALGGALFLLGAIAAGIIPLSALTVPATYAPRQFNTQQTHYMRFLVQFNSCVLVSNTCSYKVGALPYNAFIVRGYQQVTTAFNSASTDTLAVGTTSGGAQLVAAQTVHASTAGTALTIVAANLGLAVTGNNVTPTGADGGFDVYATYAQTGTAPTAGVAVVIIEYIAPNDGACINVPLATASPPC